MVSISLRPWRSLAICDRYITLSLKFIYLNQNTYPCPLVSEISLWLHDYLIFLWAPLTLQKKKNSDILEKIMTLHYIITFRKPKFKWLCHLSRHCFEVLPCKVSAITFQLKAPTFRTASNKEASSCVDHVTNYDKQSNYIYFWYDWFSKIIILLFT